MLLLNLFAAHFRYYRSTKKNIGILLIHLGIVLLLLGQFLTDDLSSESIMHIRAGVSVNYYESASEYELAITDTTDEGSDKVVTIPARLLTKPGEIRPSELPFTIRAQTYYRNSALSEKAEVGYAEVKASTGTGANFWLQNLPLETVTQKRDIPSGIVELRTPESALGTILVSGFLRHPQEFTFNYRSYQLALRPRRFYKPFSLHHVEFKFDRYPGTDIPKNFSSRVRLQRPQTGEDRELVIYMNNPLRYAGETFYQADWG